MFLYKGGQMVKKGTYWDPDTGKKIVLKDEGMLPGNAKESFFRFPESYYLIPAILIGIALSAAFPYGVGLVIFFCLIALGGALYYAGNSCYKLLKEMLGRGATFGYAPTTSYLAGKKTKKRAKGESSEEERGEGE